MLVATYLGAFIRCACSVVDAADEERRAILTDWTDANSVRENWHSISPEEDLQGFGCHPGEVWFGLRSDSGGRVEIFVDEPLSPDPQAQRAIIVPFVLGAGGRVRISDYGDFYDFALEPGHYALMFENWELTDSSANSAGDSQALATDEDDDSWIEQHIRLTFVKQDAIEPRILIADEQMRQPSPLIWHR